MEHTADQSLAQHLKFCKIQNKTNTKVCHKNAKIKPTVFSIGQTQVELKRAITEALKPVANA